MFSPSRPRASEGMRKFVLWWKCATHVSKLIPGCFFALAQKQPESNCRQLRGVQQAPTPWATCSRAAAGNTGHHPLSWVLKRAHQSECKHCED